MYETLINVCFRYSWSNTFIILSEAYASERIMKILFTWHPYLYCVLLFLSDCYTLYPNTFITSPGRFIDTMTVRDCALYCELQDSCIGFNIFTTPGVVEYRCAIFSTLGDQVNIPNIQFYMKRACDTACK